MGAGRLSSPYRTVAAQHRGPGGHRSVSYALSRWKRTGVFEQPPGTVAYVPERLDEPARITFASDAVVHGTLIG